MAWTDQRLRCVCRRRVRRERMAGSLPRWPWRRASLARTLQDLVPQVGGTMPDDSRRISRHADPGRRTGCPEAARLVRRRSPSDGRSGPLSIPGTALTGGPIAHAILFLLSISGVVNALFGLIARRVSPSARAYAYAVLYAGRSTGRSSCTEDRSGALKISGTKTQLQSMRSSSVASSAAWTVDK